MEVQKSIDFFNQYLKIFDIEIGKPFTLKAILISVQKKNGVLKKVLGMGVPEGFDFSNESQYSNPDMLRIFCRILVENEDWDNFQEIIKRLDDEFVISESSISLNHLSQSQVVLNGKDIKNNTGTQILIFKAP